MTLPIPDGIAVSEWYRMAVRILEDPGFSPEGKVEAREALDRLQDRLREPHRVQRVRRFVGVQPWVKYVGRPTLWGNPFKVDLGSIPPTDRDRAVSLFRVYAASRLSAEPGWLEPLRGYDLSCWCPLDGGPCHADVLIALLTRP